jgi:ferrous iron transport protein B
MFDAGVTHRCVRDPLFLGLMYLVFNLTFTVGERPWDEIGGSFYRLAGRRGRGFLAGRPGRAVIVPLVDGVIGGVGGVVVFLPNILLLFLAIAVLEYSGYMGAAPPPRSMDNVMHAIGLHGKTASSRC